MAIYSNNTDNADLTSALGGVAPIANDEVNINQFSTAFSANTALAVDLKKMTIGAKFLGTFTAALTFICNQASTGFVEIRGALSDFTIGSVLTANVHYEVFIKLSRQFLLTYTTCTITKLRLWAGRVYLNTDCIATDVLMMNGDLTLSGGVGPATTATLTQKGGTVLNNRIITTARVDGNATFTMDNAAGSCGDLYFNGKTFNWFRGNITTKLYCWTGTIDMSGLKVAVTINDYELGEDVTVILPPKNIMANPFTNAAKLIGNGPRFVSAS